VLGAGALALTVGCSALAGTEDEPDPSWGQEAEDWVTAYEEALSSWDRPAAIRVADFYAADVALDSYAEHYGRAAVLEVDRVLFHTASRHQFGEIYLDADGFAQTEELIWLEPGRPPSATFRLWDVGRDGVAFVENFPWLETGVVRNNTAFAEARAAAEDVAARHVQAWSGADHAALRDLYWAGATYTDSLYGVEARGQEAIVALADPESPSPSALQRASDLYSADVLALLRPPADARAVYVTRNQRHPDNRHTARVMLLLRSPGACPGASAVELTVDSAGLVVAERRLHALESVRACASPGELAEGWWTDRALPVPLSERLTGEVRTGAGTIEIRNGSPELEAFVRWGMTRFDEAGLPPPRVRSVAFDPYSPRCADFDGYSSGHRGSAAILLCADVTGIARQTRETGLSCIDLECANTRWTRVELLLHELSHAWIDTHVHRVTRDLFTRRVGAPSWSDEDDPHDERGVEVAASTLAWGLAGGSRNPPDLESVPCQDLADWYQLLTGTAPRAACP
jgi:hypothetical protein